MLFVFCLPDFFTYRKFDLLFISVRCIAFFAYLFLDQFAIVVNYVYIAAMTNMPFVEETAMNKSYMIGMIHKVLFITLPT